MKTKLKKLSKRTISIVLTLVMLVSMAVVGMVTANAYYLQNGVRVYFDASEWYSGSTFPNYMYMGMCESGQMSGRCQPMSRIPNTSVYYLDTSNTSNSGTLGSIPNVLFFSAYTDGWDKTSENLNISNISQYQGSGDTSGLTYYYTTRLNSDVRSGYSYYFRAQNGTNKQPVRDLENTSNQKIDNNSVTIWKYTQTITSSTKETYENTYSTSNTGGTVVMNAYYWSGAQAVTSNSDVTTSSENTASFSNSAKTTTVTLTATPTSGYVFDGFFDAENDGNELVSSINGTTGVGTATYIVNGNNTYYARFHSAEPLHNVSFTASAGGTISPNVDTEVGESTPIEVTATPITGYAFSSWGKGTGITLSDDAAKDVDGRTANIVTKASGDHTLQANFAKKSYTITYPASGTGYTVTPPSSSPETVQYEADGSDFTVTPAEGYDVTEVYYTVEGDATHHVLTGDGNTYKVTGMPAGNVTVFVVARQKKDITVNVGAHGKVTMAITGGRSQTFTADDEAITGTFATHVGDTVKVTAEGNPSTGYSLSTLTFNSAAHSNGDTFTVDASNMTVAATFAQKSGYYFYVSAGTGVDVTIDPSVGDDITVSAGTRQKIVFPSTETTFTITPAADSSHELPVIKRVANTIDTEEETPVTVASGAEQTYSAANEATYFVSASEKPGTNQSDFYLWYKTNAADPGSGSSGMTSAGKMKYVTNNSGSVWIDVTLAAGRDVLIINKKNDFDRNADHSTWVQSFTCSDGSVTISQVRKEVDQCKFSYIDPKTDGTYRITYTNDNTYTADIKLASSSSGSGSITASDTYYIGGRFRIADSDTGQMVDTGANEGSWELKSIKLPFTRVSDTDYTLETNMSIAQLSAPLNGKQPFFIIHNKSKIYATSGSNGLNFENNRSDSQLTLTDFTGDLANSNEILFSDEESNSDGTVVIHFNPEEKKIWYEAVGETPALGSSVSLTSSSNTVVAGTNITLTATVSGQVSGTDPLTYTFYKNGEVIQSGSSNTCTTTDATVRTDTFKVVVSTDQAAPNGKAYRSVFSYRDVKFANPALYRTKTHLDGSEANVINSSYWYETAIADSTDHSFVQAISAGQTFEFTIAKAIPESEKQFEDKRVHDFFVDMKNTRYCDIVSDTIEVSYTDEEGEPHPYSVTTYKVTPHTGCVSPTTIHINTNAYSYTDANGVTSYYPGRVYALGSYRKSTEKTKHDLATSDKKVTYYFAEATDLDDASVTNEGMAIAYWNNSMDTVFDTGASDENGTTWDARIKSLATVTAVETPVKMLNGELSNDALASNTIYVDMNQLYGAHDTSAAKEFKIYSADLPIWATSFAFIDQTDTGWSIIKTYSWNDDMNKNYEYSTQMLNPNRVYLLFEAASAKRSKGVVLDKKLWSNASGDKNNVGTKTFKSNVINYNTSYDGNSIDNGFNAQLSSRVYQNYNKALYFGYIESDPNNLNNFTLANNLAMRKNPNSYYASIQDLTAVKLDTDNLNSNGYPILEAYADAAKTQKVNMPLFDYDALADDKQSQTFTLIDKQYLGVDFPMYESSFNGITTYSYDSTTDKNRSIKKQADDSFNFSIGDYVKASDYLGYKPFVDCVDAKADKNFGNGTELDVEFYMSNSGYLKGKDGSNQDIVYNFTGDDDVWVYVDGVLVLDLGGAHMASAGSINFSDMKVYYKTAANSSDLTNTVATDTWPNSAENVVTVDMKALLEANGVNFSTTDAATKHTFQMFYLERGAFDSNMSVSFNLPQASGLNVANKIYTTYVNAGLVNATKYAANSDYFTYGLKAALNKTGTDHDIANLNSVYSNYESAASSNITTAADPKYPANFGADHVFKTTLLRNGGSQSVEVNYPLSRKNVLPNAASTFTETDSYKAVSNIAYSLSDELLEPLDQEDADHTVTGLTDAQGEFHLLGGQSASFEDKVTPHSFVQIYQTQNLGTVDYTDENTPIGFETVNNNNAGNYYTTSYSIQDNHSGTWIQERKQVPLTYGNNTKIYASDKSTNTDSFYFSDYSVNTGVNTAAMTVTFYNEVAVGDIKITKAYNGEGNPTFYFDVTFANIFGNSDNWTKSLVSYNQLQYDVIHADGSITRDVRYGSTGIAIKKDETAVIKGVPVETRYQVTERTRGNSTLTALSKSIVGPDGNAIAHATPAHGYAESFNEAQLTARGLMGTSTDNVVLNKDTYYVNMIPRISESAIDTSQYKTVSTVAFTNDQTKLKVVFKYYDRKVTNGGETEINSEPTSYTYRLNQAESNTYVSYDAGEVSSINISGLITYVDGKAHIDNVIADYSFWTSNSEALNQIQNTTRVYYTDGKTADSKTYSQLSYSNDVLKYHTDNVGVPVASKEGYTPTATDKWIVFKNNAGAVLDFDAPTEATQYQSIATIEVWGYNQPKKYSITPYNVTVNQETGEYTSGGLFYDADGNTIEEGAPDYIVGNTKGTPLTGNVYNSRVGGSYWPHYNADMSNKTEEDEKVILLNRPSEYFQNGYNLEKGYTGEYPVAEKNFSYEYDTDTSANYVFAYWASDSEGKNKITSDYQYGYRITKTMNIYPVYVKDTATKEVGVGISSVAPDLYTKNNAVYRRINNIINVYNVEPRDAKLTDISVLYVRLGVDSKTGSSEIDVSKLDLSAIRANYLAALTEAASWGSATAVTVTIDVTVKDDQDKGRRGTAYKYEVTFDEPNGSDEVQLNNKNNMLMNHGFNNTLFEPGAAFSKMIVLAAAKYNNEWKVSDNYVLYEGGLPES